MTAVVITTIPIILAIARPCVTLMGGITCCQNHKKSHIQSTTTITTTATANTKTNTATHTKKKKKLEETHV